MLLGKAFTFGLSQALGTYSHHGAEYGSKPCNLNHNMLLISSKSKYAITMSSLKELSPYSNQFLIIPFQILHINTA